jgi:hypothetical protein
MNRILSHEYGHYAERKYMNNSRASGVAWRLPANSSGVAGRYGCLPANRAVATEEAGKSTGTQVRSCRTLWKLYFRSGRGIVGTYRQTVEELRSAASLQDPGVRVHKEGGFGQHVSVKVTIGHLGNNLAGREFHQLVQPRAWKCAQAMISDAALVARSKVNFNSFFRAFEDGVR